MEEDYRSMHVSVSPFKDHWNQHTTLIRNCNDICSAKKSLLFSMIVHGPGRILSQPIPPLRGERGIVYTNEEKPDQFVWLERECSLNLLSDDDDDEKEEIEKWVRIMWKKEVKGIRHTQKKKEISSGRLFIETVHVVLTNLSKAILRLRNFTRKWEYTNVTMFPKVERLLEMIQNF